MFAKIKENVQAKTSPRFIGNINEVVSADNSVKLATVEFYDFNGNVEKTDYHTIDTPQETIVVSSTKESFFSAKTEKYTDGTVKNYIKRFNSGINSGRFLNPQSIYGNTRLDADSFDNRIGQRVCEYVEVNDSIFNLYKNFLKSRVLPYLTTAERMFKNNER